MVDLFIFHSSNFLFLTRAFLLSIYNFHDWKEET
jgi:hypothetical protein